MNVGELSRQLQAMRRRITDLEEGNRGKVVREASASGIGAQSVDKVAVLPAIPTGANNWRRVFHTVEKQIFFAATGDTVWTPEHKFTSNDGLPGS